MARLPKAVVFVKECILCEHVFTVFAGSNGSCPQCNGPARCVEEVRVKFRPEGRRIDLMPDERDASIKVQMGELVEIRKTVSGDGFILRDLLHVDHYFYYTADRKFATYDGWSAAPEDADRIDPSGAEDPEG